MTDTAPVAGVSLHNALDGGATRTLADDAREGFARPFKELPPKHLYDTRGAALFEQICELPEYYPTRLERSILERVAPDVIAATSAGELVELGSGSAAKTRLLLDAMAAAGTLRRFVAVDVTEQAVRDSAAELTQEYPGLEVHGLIGDFERHLDHLPPPREPRLLAFLGGTIGNFPPAARLRFLTSVAGLLRPADHLLLGTDLVKDRAVLEAAYDDSAGVTAEFNLNILHVLNRELGANFDPAAFTHIARFDEQEEWIEMRLRSDAAQEVELPAIELKVSFAEGEELRTEVSAKFTRERVQAELEAAGLELLAWHTDPSDWFALSLARRA
ncbi:MAG TPA: L-histidine N(alpha)-methyltransferase [Solirubrobacteraceae bacterium]|jgi:L-histidine N-alpha-methyltransferase|nr:L-histidine N(alpha)-methyltransferase [Solirubrobacteraceae bacterium]